MFQKIELIFYAYRFLLGTCFAGDAERHVLNYKGGVFKTVPVYLRAGNLSDFVLEIEDYFLCAAEYCAVGYGAAENTELECTYIGVAIY